MDELTEGFRDAIFSGQINKLCNLGAASEKEWLVAFFNHRFQ